jgi:hypothetical protein
MKIFYGIILFVALAGLGVMADSSLANSIGGPGSSCGTCQGSTYTLQYALESTSGGNSTYDITYTIDTSTYTGTATNLSSAAVKVAGASDIALGTTTLDSTPGGTWNVVDGGVSNSGCHAAPMGNGFECAQASPTVNGFDMVGGTLVWVFDITVPTGDLVTGAFQASIKAEYVDPLGHKVGAIVSENITDQPGTPPPPSSVPEPMSRLCVGSGAAMFLAKKVFASHKALIGCN